MRPGRVKPLVVLIPLLAAACATEPLQDLEPGERPAIETDEAGLWMQSDRLEERARTSGKVVRDPELNAYLRGILCKLAAGHCNEIRLYVIRHANFNASMAPNGAMFVWTGLMLRTENEAQLAYVLGHELAHYLSRHTVQRWRDIRATTDALVFFQIATAVVGLGLVGTVAQFAALGSIMSFSRDQERESDDLGLKMLRNAGYDPREAAKIWDLLILEKEVAEDPKKLIFFSTHPAAEERSETLAKMAEDFDGGAATLGREPFVAVTSRFRGQWLLDELRQRDYGRMEVLLGHMLESGPAPAELHFFRGESFRLRGEEEDNELAVAAYEDALELESPPPETYRSLGLVYWEMERPGDARSAFESYLRENPAAEDRAMIESYIQQIK